MTQLGPFLISKIPYRVQKCKSFFFVKFFVFLQFQKIHPSNPFDCNLSANRIHSQKSINVTHFND